jgi:hypothetical protein
MFSKDMSINNTTIAKIAEATITTTVEFCNCGKDGHDTF